MVIFLTVIGTVVLIVVGLAIYRIKTERPRFFSGKLKALEQSLFQELETKLPPEAGKFIPKQLEYLKRGVRIYFPKSYSLELHEDKNNPLPGDILFNRKDEFKLSIISFSYQSIKYKAEFTTYSGRIWGITIRPNPGKILGKAINSFDKFALHNDPTEKLDLEIETQLYADTENFNGILGELKQKHKLTNIEKPLPEKQRALFIKLSQTRFPDDYLLLCNQTNGFIINGVTVFGLGKLQSVSLEDDNYLVLADKSEGSLTIKQSKRTTKLKFNSYEDNTDIRDLGDNFLKALDMFIAID